MVQRCTGGQARSVHRCLWLILLACLTACGPALPAEPSASDLSSTAVIASASASATAERELPDLVPPAGTAWFGMNLDWANDSVAAVSARLGGTPELIQYPFSASASSATASGVTAPSPACGSSVNSAMPSTAAN